MEIIQAKVVDATHLELAHPIDAAQGETLLVCMGQAGEDKALRQQWLAASANRLSQAYGPEEPDYSQATVREPNAGYRP